MINWQNRADLIIPGFSKQDHNTGRVLCFPPEGVSSLEWYEQFRSRVFDALEKKHYLPIYRLSDGEFTFVLGRSFESYRGTNKLVALAKHVKNVAKFQSTFYSSGRKGYCEHYKWWEISKIRKQFIDDLQFVARAGMLCFNFSVSELSAPYRVRFIEWMKENAVPLTRDNYFHFYFVYGLLLGSEKNRVFANRKVLLLTSDMPDRNKNLITRLYELGCRNVELYQTSLNHPMKDVIDLSKVEVEPDLCLLGAGVGSVSILRQLFTLNCPCIDAGYVVDALSDVELAKKRPYCVADDEWEVVYNNSMPHWHKVQSG